MGRVDRGPCTAPSCHVLVFRPETKNDTIYAARGGEPVNTRRAARARKRVRRGSRRRLLAAEQANERGLPVRARQRWEERRRVGAGVHAFKRLRADRTASRQGRRTRVLQNARRALPARPNVSARTSEHTHEKSLKNRGSYGGHGKCRYARFFALYITCSDPRPRRDALEREYMTVTILSTRPLHQKSATGRNAPADDHHCAQEAPPRPRRARA